MAYEVIEVEKKILSGIKVKTTNENQKCIKDMGELWARFFNEGIMQKAGEPVDSSSYGLYLNYEADFSKPYEYMAAIEVSIPGSEIEVVTIPKGKFAKFSGTGVMVEVIGALWGEIWQTDLKRTYKYDFEKYCQSDDPSKQLVEVYIGIY